MSVLHSRGTGHPICDLSRIIATQKLDTLSVPSTHYVSNNCINFQSHQLAGTNWIAIDLMTVSKLTIIGSDKGLSPRRHQAIVWGIVNWTLGNKLQWNLNRISYIFIQENAYADVVWKMTAILSRPQYVNISQQAVLNNDGTSITSTLLSETKHVGWLWCIFTIIGVFFCFSSNSYFKYIFARGWMIFWIFLILQYHDFSVHF